MRFMPTQPTAKGVNVCFCDTSMPPTLMQQYGRFVRTALKDRPKIKFLDDQLRKPPVTNADRLYFPFNLDQQHWIGVCVDNKEAAIHVLDCNSSYKSESLIKKELNPIAIIFPYIIKAGAPAGSATPLRPYSMSRCDHHGSSYQGTRRQRPRRMQINHPICSL